MSLPKKGREICPSVTVITQQMYRSCRSTPSRTHEPGRGLLCAGTVCEYVDLHD